MQKTLTVNGKKFTAKQIAKLFDPANMTNGNDYIININGDKYFANYREMQDPPFALTCDADRANAIALMPEGEYHWTIWMEL